MENSVSVASLPRPVREMLATIGYRKAEVDVRLAQSATLMVERRRTASRGSLRRIG